MDSMSKKDRNLSDFLTIINNNKNGGLKSWSSMNNSFMDTLKNTTGNSEVPEKMDDNLSLYIILPIGIIACLITIALIIYCIWNGNMKRRMSSFCRKCFRSAEREKDQDVQRSADIVPEMQKLDGSQEEENAELREGEMQST